MDASDASVALLRQQLSYESAVNDDILKRALGLFDIAADSVDCLTCTSSFSAEQKALPDKFFSELGVIAAAVHKEVAALAPMLQAARSDDVATLSRVAGPTKRSRTAPSRSASASAKQDPATSAAEGATVHDDGAELLSAALEQQLVDMAVSGVEVSCGSERVAK